MDRKDPRLSPIFGPIDGIGHMTVFVGTHELLLNDSRRLLERCMAEKIPIDYYECPRMTHVFPLHPTPEAVSARHIIAGIVNPEK